MMSSTRGQHLTDAEFSDLLAGEEPGEATQAHLRSCEFCSNEWKSVRSSLDSLNSLGTSWAQRTAPSRIPIPSRWRLHLAAGPTWASGLAATAITGLLVFSYGQHAAHKHPSMVAAPAITLAATANTPPTNAELVNDNRLMRSIDQELSGEQKPAVSASELRTGTHHTTRRGVYAVAD